MVPARPPSDKSTARRPAHSWSGWPANSSREHRRAGDAISTSTGSITLREFRIVEVFAAPLGLEPYRYKNQEGLVAELNEILRSVEAKVLELRGTKSG